MFRRSLAQVFAAVSGTRMAMYDKEMPGFTAHVPKVPVISVGNIAVGGRGKSPLACYITNYFHRHGCAVALLLRGYRGGLEKSGGWVSVGDGPVVGAREAGDEAYVASLMCPGAMVHAGQNRVLAAAHAVDAGVKVIVLDDGFQHRKFARNLDIVSVAPWDMTSTVTFFPHGPLRESPRGLQRAHVLAGYAEDWTNHPHPPALLFRHSPRALMTAAFQSYPLSFLPESVHLVCAIEVPQRFEDTVKKLGVAVTSSSVFRDHHVFTERDIADAEQLAARSGAKAIITTVKDLPRLPAISPSMPLWGLATALEFVSGESLLHHHLDLLIPRTRR